MEDLNLQKDNLLSIFISIWSLLIVIFMIIPLPSNLVDQLIVLGLIISGGGILMAFFLPKGYPYYLLLVTLYRFSINVSMTRLRLLGEEINITKVLFSFFNGMAPLLTFSLFLGFILIQCAAIIGVMEKISKLNDTFFISLARFIKFFVITELIITLINVMGGLIIGKILDQDLAVIVEKLALSLGGALIIQVQAFLISAVGGYIFFQKASERA